jgi:hypothetical protein
MTARARPFPRSRSPEKIRCTDGTAGINEPRFDDFGRLVGVAQLGRTRFYRMVISPVSPLGMGSPSHVKFFKHASRAARCAVSSRYGDFTPAARTAAYSAPRAI